MSVNGGLLNSLLGGLLGGNLSLRAMDYQSLISTQIDLFGFSNALATRLNLTGPTYNSLLSTNVKATDMVGAMIDASRAGGGNSTEINALTSIAGSMSSSTSTVQLNQLISFGPLGNMPVGTPALIAQSVSAFDLLSAVAQVANGTHEVAVNLGAAVPGILSASLKVTIGEMPVGSSWVAIGFQGASVHTAQTRILLQVQLAGSGQVSVVDLPVYIEVASGTATLNTISCGRPDISTSTVTLGVTPGVVSAWIGNVSDADMTNYTSEPNPGPATLVNLPPLATISGLANASMTNLSPTSVTFNYTQIQNATKQTTSTTDFLSSLLGSLIGNLQLNVNLLGLGIGLPSGLTGLVGGIVSAALNPVDQLVAGLLGTLGVGLGQADTWVSGVRCSGAVLVN